MGKPFTSQMKVWDFKKSLTNSQFSFYFLLPSRLFCTVQQYELQMLKVFTHSFPKAEDFALKAVVSQVKAAWEELREEISVPEISNQSLATQQGGARTQWGEMLCLLPAALP